MGMGQATDIFSKSEELLASIREVSDHFKDAVRELAGLAWEGQGRAVHSGFPLLLPC